MPTPGEPIPIDNQVTVTQLRAQWGVPSFGEGESSWSFILPAANDRYQAFVAEVWMATCLDLFRAARPQGWFLNQIVVEDRWPALRAARVYTGEWGSIPETLVSGLPPQCTPVISWRTGAEGRSQRGRTYWGPCRLDSCIYSNVVNEGEDAVHAFATEMILRFTGGDFPSNPRFAIVSRVQNGVPVEPVGTYLPVIEYLFQARFGVQRRRLQWEWRY